VKFNLQLVDLFNLFFCDHPKYLNERVFSLSFSVEMLSICRSHTRVVRSIVLSRYPFHATWTFILRDGERT
jgi:hypothetical protein